MLIPAVVNRELSVGSGFMGPVGHISRMGPIGSFHDLHSQNGAPTLTDF